MNEFAETSLFLKTLVDIPSDAATACEGWTAHELVAHVAAGGAELLRTLDAHIAGDPIPPTRDFETREAPYRRLEDAALRERLHGILARLDARLALLAGADPSETVAWSGRYVPVSFFATHMRSELALHRWDLVGTDEAGDVLLGQDALFVHAMRALAPLLVSRADPPSRDWRIRLEVDGQARALLRTGPSGVVLEFEDGRAEVDATIASDATSRLLLLWGRPPAVPGRTRVSGPAGAWQIVRQSLRGF